MPSLSIVQHLILSNIIKHCLHAHFCLLASDPELLALTFTQASQSLRPPSIPSIYHPSYPYKECPPSRFSGAPSVSVCPGRRAPGLRSTESKFWISRNCVMFLLYFLTATLSNCQLNYCKMLHKFWESCISSSKASSLVKWLFCVILMWINWCTITIS